MTNRAALEYKPDRWHALSATGKLLTTCLYKSDVIKTKAHYYVLLQDSSSYLGSTYIEQDKHYIFDQDFNEVRLEHNGLVCTEVLDGYGGFYFTVFTIVDKLGIERVLQFKRGIKVYEQVFEAMQELSNYEGGWKDLEQTLEIRTLKQQIKDLEQENQTLRLEAEKLDEAKSILRKLGQLLIADSKI